MVKKQKNDNIVWDDTIFVKEFPEKKAVKVSEVKDFTEEKEGYYVNCYDIPFLKLKKKDNKTEISNMNQAYGYGKNLKYNRKMIAIARMMYGTSEGYEGENFLTKKEAYNKAKECVKKY